MRWMMAMVLGTAMIGLAANADAGEDHWIRDRGRPGEKYARVARRLLETRVVGIGSTIVVPSYVAIDTDKAADTWKGASNSLPLPNEQAVVRPVNSRCPMCTKAVDRTVTTTWNKEKVAFHTQKCLEAWNKLNDRQKAKKLKDVTEPVKKR